MSQSKADAQEQLWDEIADYLCAETEEEISEEIRAELRDELDDWWRTELAERLRETKGAIVVEF